MPREKYILFAEDNPDDALLTRMALEDSKLCNRIIHVEDGVLLLDYLFARGVHAERDPNDLPTLLLLDINMPRLTGLEALQEIRAQPLTRRLPVVMLTTSKEEQDLVQSYDLGANSYVRKPVDFDQFMEAVRHLGLYWLVMNEPSPA